MHGGSSAGGRGGDMSGNEPRAGVEHNIAFASLGSGWDDVFARLRRMLFGAALCEANGLRFRVEVSVLEHHDVVRARWDRGAGHDLHGATAREFDRGTLDRVAGANLAGDGKRLAQSKFRGITGIPVARGTVEWWLVAVGEHRPAKHAAEGIGQAQNLSLALICEANGSCVIANQCCSVREAQDGRSRI